MSRQNVEIVQRMFDARSHGDMEAVLAEAAPDIEFDFTTSMSPYAGVYRGHEAIMQLWHTLTDAWGEMRWEADEFIDAGDAVVVPARFRSRGRGSGIESVARGAEVYWLRDGKVVRYRQCQGRAEALEAVGFHG